MIENDQQKLKPNSGDENRVISYHKIRIAVGFIGILLPFCLWIGNSLINMSNVLNNKNWITFQKLYEPQANLKTSISHFYYSTVGEIFTGALCAVALFLFCYRGYPKPTTGKYHIIPGDSFMCNFAAAMALLVVIFPTSSTFEIKDNLRAFVSSDIAGYIHYGSAALFFMTLSIISFVNFRRTKYPEQFGKMKSHAIYKNCAIIMMTCMAILIGIFIWEKTGHTCSWTETYTITYWLETIMLVAFGISWIVKGEIDQQLMNKNIFGNGVAQ
jgi:hypothetical protein